MYLILRTAAPVQDGGLTACAVTSPTTETTDYWLGMIEQARQLSTKLGKTTTLSCADGGLDCYELEPESDAFGTTEEDFWTQGWCLLDDPPYSPARDTGEVSSEPLDLAYCEIHASPKGLYWSFAVQDKFSLEEETTGLAVETLAQIRQAYLDWQQAAGASPA